MARSCPCDSDRRIASDAGPHQSAPQGRRKPGSSRSGGSVIRWRSVPALYCVLLAMGIGFSRRLGGAVVAAKLDITTPRAITPLPVPRVSDLKQFDGAHRERLYWGTYRPFAYLGIRARVPESLLAGLMWSNVEGGQTVLRHYCDDTDNLTRWSWQRHDGSTYGRQVLVDQGLVITTYFLKSTEKATGYGGDWVVRVKIEKDHDAAAKIEEGAETRSLFFYMAHEAGQAVNLGSMRRGAATQPTPFAEGQDKEVGSWQLQAKYKDDVSMNYAGVRELYMPNLTYLVQSTLNGQKIATGDFRLPDTSEKDSNVALIQLSGKLPLEMEIVFVSGVEKRSAQVLSRIQKLTGTCLDNQIVAKEIEFEERFIGAFNLQKVTDEKELETGRVALSNMLGGIGYFFGQSRIEIPVEFKNANPGVDYWLYWPASLYTGVPGRSVYPRGFLWDEGFHQLLVSRWDINISKEIIANWMDLINVDGWIPREQILGDEARSKVPADYINQKTDNANPPALLLVVRGLAKKFHSDSEQGLATADDVEFFKTLFPRLEVWFNWFNTTQIGKESTSYYWRGRVLTDEKLNPPTLTSGMDDYPRASHPSDDERHVDLRCWIANAADSMALIAEIVGMPSEKFAHTAKLLKNMTRLNELHYDLDSGRYYDYGNHSEQVELRWTHIVDPVTGILERVLRRVVLEPPKLGWVPQFGLNSLFPFLMEIIPVDSPILENHLRMLEEPDLMWTSFGLRSMATTSSIYMKYNSEFEAPYWRGPVWININYLILSALRNYSQESGPYSARAAALYLKFRANLISNIVRRFQETGYIWENYDNAANGKGQGVHPFTGWTSLVLLIMGDIY